jgi:DNA-binding SARP family transcriptional activator/Flp pilus assembly protein TadD
VSVTRPLRTATGASPGLSIQLLGPPRIERNARHAQPDTRKAVALLAYLAVTATPQARDRVAAMLWPEADTERARGALRRTLSALRDAIGDALVTEGSSVALALGDARVDVRTFRERLARRRWDEAIAAYRGDFLEGFGLRDSPEFDDWQSAQADALRVELATALERARDDAARDDDRVRAAAHARRRVQLDPLHEPAARALIGLLAALDDRAGALRAYEAHAKALHSELGATPSDETRAVRDAIRDGRFVWAPPEVDAAPPPDRRAAEAGDAWRIHLAVGDAHTLHGDYRRAVASYEEAARLAPAGARAEVEHRLGEAHHRRGDLERAEHHYRSALGSARDGSLRARVLADLGLTAHRAGQDERAASSAREALALAEREGDAGALALAHDLLGILASARGDAAAARSHLEESLELAGRAGDEHLRVAVLNNLALAYAREGAHEHALRLAEEALAGAAPLGDRHREAAIRNNLADLLHALGREDDAMRHLKRAVAGFAQIEGGGTLEPGIWKLVEW